MKRFIITGTVADRIALAFFAGAVRGFEIEYEHPNDERDVYGVPESLEVSFRKIAESWGLHIEEETA